MVKQYPHIRLSAAKKIFGNANRLAKALEINRSSVSEWKARGLIYLPEKQAWRLAVLYPSQFGHLIPAVHNQPLVTRSICAGTAGARNVANTLFP